MKNRPIYGRIPVDYAPMQDLSIDIKTMPQAFGGYHLLLVITCDQTSFMIAVPLRDRTAQTIAEALIYSYISIWTTQTNYFRGSYRIYISHYTSYTLHAQLQAQSNKSLQPW